MGPIGTVRRSFLAAGYSRGKVKMQLNNVKRVGNDKESLTGLLTVKHGSNQVTESATAKWSSTDKGFKVVSSGVSTIIDGEDSISVVFNMSDLGLEKTMSLSVNNSIDLSSSTSSTSSSDRTVTALSNYNQVTTLLSDVDKNEADADEADAALSARLDVLEADPTTATAVAKVESDGYAVATAAAEREAAADAALSARLDALEASTTTYEFDFSIANTNDIYVTWYDADTTQDSVVSDIATLKTEDGTLGTSIFAAALEDDDGHTAFISSETNFIADVPGSQTAGSLAIGGILELEENGDEVRRVVKDSIRGTIRETIMATINDVTYTFNRTLAIANFQLTYDPTRANDYYPDIVYQTPRGDKLTVSINSNNMRNYTFELINGFVLTESQDEVTEGDEEDENDEVVVESTTCTDTKDAFFLTNVDTEPLDTLSGGYNGSDFVFSTSTADSEQEAIVGGTIDINGVGTVEATFSFKSVRYVEGDLYEEHLQILSPVGCLVANALYIDYGVGFTSTAERADFLVHTSYGELRETKGNLIRITFNNVDPCLPRTIALVPSSFGANKVNANLLQTESDSE